MMQEEYLLLQKEVDISVLREGMTITMLYHKMVDDKLGHRLVRGESMEISIHVQGKEYPAQLRNLGISSAKHPGHGDLLQIRYTRGSELSLQLQSVFSASWDYILEARSERTLLTGNDPGTKRHVVIPDDRKEFIAVYTTPLRGHLVFDCITCSEYQQERSIISSSNELLLEISCMEDATAEISISAVPHKIRRLSKAIGESLKLVYGYRCQICGQQIGARYGSQLIHAHHIDYFTRSLNNDADNIMIVCPNHHGIIHDRNPIFNKKDKTFTYPNGLTEGLAINKHL